MHVHSSTQHAQQRAACTAAAAPDGVVQPLPQHLLVQLPRFQLDGLPLLQATAGGTRRAGLAGGNGSELRQHCRLRQSAATVSKPAAKPAAPSGRCRRYSRDVGARTSAPSTKAQVRMTFSPSAAASAKLCSVSFRVPAAAEGGGCSACSRHACSVRAERSAAARVDQSNAAGDQPGGSPFTSAARCAR